MFLRHSTKFYSFALYICTNPNTDLHKKRGKVKMYTAIYVYNMYYTIPVQESIMSPNHWQSATTKFCASCLYSYSMSSAV